MTALLPALAGSGVIYGMGLLDMGTVFSYSQLLIDREIVRMVRRVMQGITVNRETLAVEVIKSVGAGGNYLTEQHTLTHMRREQSRTALIDRRSGGEWERTGSKTMLERAEEEVFKIMDTHKPKPLPQDVCGELRRIIAEAEMEIAEGKEQLK
jgi:trimethylamine--corrinoid protein Co-methyltransferase